MSEKSVNNLKGAEAAQKIQELVNHTHTCVMMTALSKRPISARPMGIQKVDEKGRIYFFSEKDSEKNSELLLSDEMQLIISNQSNSEYVTLYGRGEVYRDQQQINEMYNAFANNWFNGKEDPMITIIRFIPEEGHYWDSKHGKLVQMFGILVGAITGKQMDDGMEGDIRLNQL